MSFAKGDVVLTYFPYIDHDGDIVTKKRPALIYDVLWDRQYVVIQITTTNRSDKLPGIWIPKDSDTGQKMGLLQDSFINVGKMIKVHFRDIYRVIGSCDLMSDIDDIVEEHDIKPPEP